MHALPILKQNLSTYLDKKIHAARMKTFFWLIEVLLIGNKLSLTALGRSARGETYTKHHIKRVDRFLGNEKFHKEVNLVYGGLAKLLIEKVKRPIICVDWTPIGDSHYGLVASVPVDGRALPLYEEVYEKKDNNTDRAHNKFLKNLKEIVPSGCHPIIVTDAGFKNPWFKSVRLLGWDYLGRTGSITKAGKAIDSTTRPSKIGGDEWIDTKKLMKQANGRAQKLGKWFLAKSNPIKGNLILGKKVTQTKSSGKKKRKPATAAQKKARNRALEPWLLITSLNGYSAKAIVKLYAKRMQIEEMFRDTKNPRYGWSFRHANSQSCERLRVLLLVAAVAMIAVTLVGQTGERHGLQRKFQANTIRNRRVLSLFVLGVMLISNELDKQFQDDEFKQSFDEIQSKFGWSQ